MKTRTKMLLMKGAKNGRDYPYDDYYNGYPRSERSGSRVRRNDGTYAPVYPGMRYDDDVENRFRDGRGREHYDNGRYAPMNAYYDRRSIEPMYEDDYITRPIGFRMEPNRDRGNTIGMNYPYMSMPYMDNAPYVGDTVHSHSKEMGYASSDMSDNKLTEEEADHWMRTIKNTDGKTGAHWTKDQAKQVMQQQGIECDPLEFWVTINMIYSDFYRVAKECNCNTIQFYSAMAEAFLDDNDAQPNKLRRYYHHIVKHR